MKAVAPSIQDGCQYFQREKYVGTFITHVSAYTNIHTNENNQKCNNLFALNNQ